MKSLIFALGLYVYHYVWLRKGSSDIPQMKKQNLRALEELRTPWGSRNAAVGMWFWPWPTCAAFTFFTL